SRIYIVIVATCVAGLLWLPVWQNNHDPQMMQWIQTSDRTFITWIAPIFQALAAWITMISLLPVEASSLLIVILSGLIMICFFFWAIPIFYRGLKSQLKNSQTCLPTSLLGGFVLGAISLFFAITYILGTDLTRGARYNFLYFPGVIVLVAAALKLSWNTDKNHNSKPPIVVPPNLLESISVSEQNAIQNSKLFNHFPFQTSGKRAVAVIWIMGFVSGITVVSNLGYQKYYRPDLLVPIIQNVSSVPVLMATTHNTLVQTGEMMGLGWEFKRSAKSKLSQKNPQFLLAHQDEEECEKIDCPASKILQQTLSQLPRPLDVWLVNFKAPVVDPLNCFAEDISEYPTSVDGYHTKLYHCLEDDT
ncbi:MAG TPA: glycosyltransferase, partial [Cyanobacteria bacterium UBA11162]|nr:glycosyltransferase [Cyanobacteria bacterium UBA11162]